MKRQVFLKLQHLHHDNLYGSGTFVYLNDLEFSCAAPHAGVTTTIFPDGTQGFEYPVTGITSAKTFEVNVGTSTIPHTYESGGTVREYYPQVNLVWIRGCW